MLFETTRAQLQEALKNLTGDLALAFSHQAEDVVVLHLLQTLGVIQNMEIFTLQTGKLFPETAAYHEELERFFGLKIKAYTPDAIEVERLERELGEWGMRESLEKRHACCRVRKIEPLKKALSGKSAWITGLRAEQSITRTNIGFLEWDEAFGLHKVNPLVKWSEAEVFSYAKAHALPLHPLYAQGFRSIGCAPCTRAIKPREEIRAGRWWWENPEHKECGLHLKEQHG